MNWQDIITSLILSFILNGVLMLIFKSIIDAAHDRDIAKIQQSNAKELAKLNADLNKMQMIHTTQFANLHERRTQVIAELYKLLARAEKQLHEAKSGMPSYVGRDKAAWERFIEKIRPIYEAVSKVSDFYGENKIFLSPDQITSMDEIVKIFNETKAAWTAREQLKEMPPEDETQGAILWEMANKWILNANHRFGDVYPTVKVNLESDFRNIPGFGISQS